MIYKPFCNTEIEFQTLDELKYGLLSLPVSNIVLVMSEESAIWWNMTSFIDELAAKCESTDGALIWIKSIVANPTPGNVLQSLQEIGNRQIDSIIAIGGGSVLDLAKTISAFHKVEHNSSYVINDIQDSIKNKKYHNAHFINIIAVPSTAGTGSEITQWATIWDEEENKKYSIDHQGLQPKLALIVPELTLSMPAELTLSTGLDAMCQSIEAYWSRHTTPIVQEIAYRAIEIVIKNLRNAVEQPLDLTVRENLCKASVLSGLAFSHTRTTACHSISYPLTMLYGIPHGLAAAISLDPVGEINKGHFPNDVALFGLFSQYDGIKNYIDTACESVIEMRLSAFGITEKDIPIIVDNAFTGGRMDNNPVDLDKNDVTMVLNSIM